MKENTVPPFVIHLRSGETLPIKKLGISGYVAAPIGSKILGGEASRDMVGKFVVGVVYDDGQPGAIPQEEIQEIRDSRGNPIEYGNSKYPGHPDFDPRDGFDPEAEMIETFKRLSSQKMKRWNADQQKNQKPPKD